MKRFEIKKNILEVSEAIPGFEHIFLNGKILTVAEAKDLIEAIKSCIEYMESED